MDNRVPYPLNVVSRSMKFTRKPTQWRRTTHLKDGRRTVGSTSRWPATAH